MTIHHTHIEAAAPLSDGDTAIFVRMIHRQNAWRIFPYGEWTEPSGSKVIFDRQYRAIAVFMSMARSKPCRLKLGSRSRASVDFIAALARHLTLKQDR